MNDETAEAIGRVVADLRAGRQSRPWSQADPDKERADRALFNVASSSAGQGPTIDCTAIYAGLVKEAKPVAIYEDHPCVTPPWPLASFCYRNEHGNVLVASMSTADVDDTKATPAGTTGPWETTNEVDWAEVRWVADVFLWVGGRGQGGPFPTRGPVHMWQLAIYGDGSLADVHWVQLNDYPMEQWDMAGLVLLGSLNFLNCANVSAEYYEPTTRHARKRQARTGVKVSTINVRPLGKRSRSTKGEPVGGQNASVRGHYSHYGACCPHHPPRGLLFGKLTGRYWVPQHVRGEGADKDYTLAGEQRADAGQSN